MKSGLAYYRVPAHLQINKTMECTESSTIIMFFFSVLSDFGYEHPDIDEVCVATSSANPIPNPCPEGKTYLHSRG